MPETIDMRFAPGHLFRRAQQAHSYLWAQFVGTDVTSVQFAILNVLASEPGIDQSELGQIAHLDRSTTADVVSRLVRSNLIVRLRDPRDLRRKLLRLSPQGMEMWETKRESVVKVGDELMKSLEPGERTEALRLLNKVLDTLER